jgi:hypothetical protein
VQLSEEISGLIVLKEIFILIGNVVR